MYKQQSTYTEGYMLHERIKGQLTGIKVRQIDEEARRKAMESEQQGRMEARQYQVPYNIYRGANINGSRSGSKNYNIYKRELLVVTLKYGLQEHALWLVKGLKEGKVSEGEVKETVREIVQHIEEIVKVSKDEKLNEPQNYLRGLQWKVLTNDRLEGYKVQSSVEEVLSLQGSLSKEEFLIKYVKAMLTTGYLLRGKAVVFEKVVDELYKK